MIYGRYRPLPEHLRQVFTCGESAPTYEPKPWLHRQGAIRRQVRWVYAGCCTCVSEISCMQLFGRCSLHSVHCVEYCGALEGPPVSDTVGCNWLLSEQEGCIHAGMSAENSQSSSLQASKQLR